VNSRYNEIVKRKKEEDQLLFSYLPSHIKSQVNLGAKLHNEETNELVRKTGWELWKVLSIWMRLTERN